MCITQKKFDKKNHAKSGAQTFMCTEKLHMSRKVIRKKAFLMKGKGHLTSDVNDLTYTLTLVQGRKKSSQ